MEAFEDLWPATDLFAKPDRAILRVIGKDLRRTHAYINSFINRFNDYAEKSAHEYVRDAITS